MVALARVEPECPEMEEGAREIKVFHATAVSRPLAPSNLNFIDRHMAVDKSAIIITITDPYTPKGQFQQIRFLKKKYCNKAFCFKK